MLFDANHKLWIGRTGFTATPEDWQGSIDDVSIYSAALTPRQVAAHYAAGGSVVLQDQQTVYDSHGNPTQALDNFLTNPGFASNFDGWSSTGASISTDHYPDPGTANQSSALLAASGTVSQIVSLVPGQTFRVQTALKTAGATGKFSIDYQKLDGTWTTDWFTIADSNSAWHLAAWDVTGLPMESTGQVKLTFKNTGSASGAYVDDVALFTTYKGTSYNANGTVATVTEVSGATGANATTVSNYDYGSPASYAQGTNLLANGGLAHLTGGVPNSWALEQTGATGYFTGWTGAEGWTRTLVPADGDTTGVSSSGAVGSLGLIHVDSFATGGVVDMAQYVPVVAGHTYSLSGLVANHRLSCARLVLSFLDSGGTHLADTTAPCTFLTAWSTRSNWAYQALTLTAPAGATTAAVKVEGDGPFVGGTDGWLWTDEIRLVDGATPEPYIADTAVTPAIFPTRVTTNVVSGGTAPDQNAASLTSYDRWGRSIVSIDPDGVGSTTMYALNSTDVAATSDGLGNVKQSIAWDAVGDVTSSTDPLGNITNSAYNYAGAATDVTSAYGTSLATTSHTDFNNAGRPINQWSNYSGGGSPQSGDQNLETTTTYDSGGNGWVVRTVSDDGGTTAIAATTDKTYDFQGAVLTTTAYAVTGVPASAETTTSHFDAAGNATGVQSPIAPTASAPLCPDSSTQLCNSTSKVDLNGYSIDSYAVDDDSRQSYGTRTHTWYDIAGRAVRTISNYVAGTAFSSTTNLATDTRYDLGGRPLYASQYLIPCGLFTSYTALSAVPAGCVFTTSTTYDALGRSLGVTKPDSSWTHTVYTKAGRVDRASRPGGTSDNDSTVAWTKNVYDAAGRQTATFANYDTTGNAQFQITSFESGTLEGVTGTTTWAQNAPVSLDATTGTAASGTANSGYGAMTFATAASTQNQGVSLVLSGTFVAGHTYEAAAYAKAGSAGQAWRIVLGANGTDQNGTGASGDATKFTKLTTIWAPTQTYTGNIRVALVGNANQSSANTVYLDDIEVWDMGSVSSNTPSLSVFDAAGHPVASVLPGGAAGDSLMVTRTTFDALGRTADVTVNAIAGAGMSAADTNLKTAYTYDGLSRNTDVTDPAGHDTHTVYDRLGRTIEGDTAWSSGSSTLGITALANYDALGQLLDTCSPNAVAAGCTAASIHTSNLAWHYAYDAMGHQVTAAPPVNAFTALASTSTTYELGGAGRLQSQSQGTRTTTMGYDVAARTASTAVVDTALNPTTLTSTLTLDSLGRTTQAQTTGSSTDTLAETFDALGRMLSISRGGTPITAYTYNPDGSAATRTDNNTTVYTFTYTKTGQLASATMGSLGYAEYTWRLDGSLATRSWGSNAAVNPTTNAMVGTYSYDGAKRPTALTLQRNGAGSADSFARTYDRVGNVTSETQTFGGTSGGTGFNIALTTAGTQYFNYDAAGRLTSSNFDGTTTDGSAANTLAYTYDADGNRTEILDAAVPMYSFYDRTDELIARNATGTAPTGSGCAAGNFCYDAMGALKTSLPAAVDYSTLVPTTYTYDPAGHLLTIDDGTPAQKVTFTIDALGRHASQAIGTGTPTPTVYSYLGTSDTVTAMSGGSTGSSTVDAIGDRLATNDGTGSAYVLPDLHGNVVAAVSTAASPVFLSAYRYDGFGQTCGSWTASSGSVNVPWRFQGRMIESAAGATDLYDFAARSYDPSLGAFTSFDSVTGSAQNPLTLNRYLYANANPVTLVDPDGHTSVMYDGGSGGNGTRSAAQVDDDTEWRFIHHKQTPIQAAASRARSAAFAAANGGQCPAGTSYRYDGSSLSCQASLTSGAITNGSGQSTTDTSPADVGRPDCGWNPFCDINNAVGTAGDLWSAGPGKTVNQYAAPIAVIVVVAGSVAACNVLFEVCSAVVLAIIGTGAAACATEAEEECAQVAAEVVDGTAPEVDATVAGSQRAPLKVPEIPINEGAEVGGTSYSGHALDQMQARGIPPSVVGNTISEGVGYPGKFPGTYVIYDSANNVSVVLNTAGKVITVGYGQFAGGR